jgi:hypothetical protein
MRLISLFLLLNIQIFSQINFDEYFLDKTLRIDYYHSGDSEKEFYSIDELIEEPFWGGSKKNLIDKFNLGNFIVQVLDSSSGKMIYSTTYSTLFNEWLTTEEAKQTTKSFSETVVIPFPKNKVRVDFFSRDKKNNPVKMFEYFVDPENYFIRKERNHEYEVFDILISGDPSIKADIIIIPEGYTKEELEKFKKDAEKFAGYLFNSSPFKENKNKFNIRAVMAPSEESGTDVPGKNIWKKTLLNSNFYTFDLDRYLMTHDNKTVRDVAANAPYDNIYIIVNTSMYGGGAIYNHYAVCVSDSKYEEYVFVHEFGHNFASLADEYYDSETTYIDFYPLDVEPLDPNLTTLVDFDSKWKNMVDESTPIPTPDEEEYRGKVGVFEGGGYVNKGVYRPQYDCTMKSLSVDNFCKVCEKAIIEMIDFYAE